MATNILSREQIEDAARLKAIFNAKKQPLRLTQESLAARLGFSNQSGVSHYLNAKAALNINAAVLFAEALQVSVGDFSPRLQSEIDRIAQFATGMPAPRAARVQSEWPFSVTREQYDRLSRGDKARINVMFETFVRNFADLERPRKKSSRAA
ncbi:helix-turn-helix domain-containing protein [Bordetella sp. H567]|uniref:helix-turn-helix domain-containing protein n=1 Tax=Bordetella sp. H567 TaxID=1697043 RepID=UPI00082C9186|nr:helix-turn-helix transcriptional regulator [Bordetella sp. H567]